MREMIEHQFACRTVQWNEAADAGDGALFSAITREGALVCAESIALLITALQDEGGDTHWRMAA